MTKQTRQISFTKMHGLGNDFVIINTLTQSFDVDTINIQAFANRHSGIGFDQLLTIHPSTDADYFIRIFNSDGSEAEQCGNGLRCIARYVNEDESLKHPNKLTLATKAGIFPVSIADYDHIRIAMGVPTVMDRQVLIDLNNHTQVNVTNLSLGNPHAIVKINESQTDFFDLHAHEIATHSRYIAGTNVGCMIVVDPHSIKLRTLERGTGETYACGSNACAAVVAGILNNWIAQNAQVDFQSGSLFIEWSGDNTPVYMTGPASRVFEGQFRIPDIKRR